MAIFEFTEDSFIEAVWAAPLYDTQGDITGDILAILYRDTATAPWQVTFRLRRYVDAQTWGSRDEKESYAIRATDDPAAQSACDRLTNQTDAFFTQLPGVHRSDITRLIVHGDTQDFQRAFSRLPFAHTRVMPPAPKGVQ